MFNILVAGSNGQLGSEIKELSSNYSYNFFFTDRNSIDITCKDSMRDYCKVNDINVIINCAAYTAVDKAETDIENADIGNRKAVKKLALVSKELNIKLIHISTDYIFSGEGAQPFVEWDTPAPQSIYGKTKALGERYVSEFCSRYFIIRTAWLYGYYGNNFVKTIMRVAKEQGEIKVVDDQRGNPTNAADLAHHILKLASTEEYGIYHGTGTGECSWFDFATKIVEFASIKAKVNPCTTEEFPRPAKRPAYSSLENMMFKVINGDEFRQWEEALKYFIEKLEEN